jgi:hypothetical protein
MPIENTGKRPNYSFNSYQEVSFCITLNHLLWQLHLDIYTTLLDPTVAETRVLVTHVPLYRPNHAQCGPLRRARPLDQGAGFQYQNLIVESLSNTILNAIQPTLILSGDDHDWCFHVHNLNGRSYPEYTLGTFSWLQGNHYPSFGMLKLDSFAVSSSSYAQAKLESKFSKPEVLFDPCFLPNQYTIFLLYTFSFISTVLYLLFDYVYLHPPRSNPYTALQSGPGTYGNYSFLFTFNKIAFSLLQIAFIPLVFYILLNATL